MLSLRVPDVVGPSSGHSSSPVVLGSVSRGSDSTQTPLSRRRDKPRLSCDFCRQRKTKCDRERPCGPCTKRGLALSCSYPANSANPTTPTARGGPTPVRSRPGHAMQDRIRHLENLVVDLMQKTASKDGSPLLQPHPIREPTAHVHALPPLNRSPKPESVSPSECGSIEINGSTGRYLSSSHWAAVLDEIAELKHHFEREREDEDRAEASNPVENYHYPSSGPYLLYGCPQYATKDEVIKSMPSRPTVDRLVSRYFNAFDMSPGESFNSKLWCIPPRA